MTLLLSVLTEIGQENITPNETILGDIGIAGMVLFVFLFVSLFLRL